MTTGDEFVAVVRRWVAEMTEVSARAVDALVAGDEVAARALVGTIDGSISAAAEQLRDLVAAPGWDAADEFDGCLFRAIAALVPGVDAVVDVVDRWANGQ